MWMGLGRNVGKLVKDRGLSYGEVARGIGIEDAQPIWALVKRNSKKSDFASRLADYFKVPLDRLMAADFDVSEASTTTPPSLGQLRLEELQAIKNLREALPEWRRYVLSLAMTTSKDRQQLFLDMMREHVPDDVVARAYGTAPHVKKVKEPK